MKMRLEQREKSSPWLNLTLPLVAIAATLFGIRHDDAIARGFGVTFLFINLYTRFFEIFWDNTHKTLFFAMLGASLWYLGTRAEKIWQLGEK